MIYRINQARMPLNYTKQQVESYVHHLTGLKAGELDYIEIIRRSLDARRQPVYILTVEIKTEKKLKPRRDIQVYKPTMDKFSSLKVKNYTGRQPVIVGAGPAGLMAACLLAENGLKPVVIERGNTAKNRAGEISQYLQTGELNKESNILFGEGGAGLFSDGKLTARSKDRRLIKYFFEKLVACGASENILIDAEPHLGSDVLLKIIPKMRREIIELGGTFYFNTKMDAIITEGNSVAGISTKDQVIDTEFCILATGHSARDVYRSLSGNGITLVPKSFAIGVRLELPQKIVDQSQYGKFAGHPSLGAASFRLTRRAEKNYRPCYTFCMCPGGEVMPCASSDGMITTNGMSWSARSGPKANAAFLVPIAETDYQNFINPEFPALEGIFFQESIEEKIFTAGGNDYRIPAARLSDFLNNRASANLPENSSCKRTKITKINGILPGYVESTLKYSIPKMLGKIGRPDFHDVTVYCGETRSSSPVRINRNEEMESVNTRGLYPCGEGAGYAGGIVSSAIDGLKAAEALLKKIRK